MSRSAVVAFYLSNEPVGRLVVKSISSDARTCVNRSGGCDSLSLLLRIIEQDNKELTSMFKGMPK